MVTLIKQSQLPLPVVEFKKLYHYADSLPDPYYASELAAGFDLHAALEGYDVYIAPGKTMLIPTGLVMAIPKGYEGQVRPRSGLAAKYNVTVLNSPGTIDADYRGEIKVLLINHHPHNSFMVSRGDRIAQLVIAPVQRVALKCVDNLDNTARGTGGFGSSGIN